MGKGDTVKIKRMLGKGKTVVHVGDTVELVTEDGFVECKVAEITRDGKHARIKLEVPEDLDVPEELAQSQGIIIRKINPRSAPRLTRPADPPDEV